MSSPFESTFILLTVMARITNIRLRLRFYITRASCLKQFQAFTFVLTPNSGFPCKTQPIVAFRQNKTVRHLEVATTQMPSP
jgi:hypothetical protein